MKSFKLFLDQITEAAKKKKPNIDGDGDTGKSMKDAADDEEDEEDEEDDKNNDKKDK